MNAATESRPLRQDARSEYFPSAEEFNGNGHAHGNGNGNGHNGHAKIFSLKPATDPDTLAILDARRSALAEPTDRLNRSMKACFCEILDRALDPRFFDAKGVVTISDSVLAQTFSVSNRTIYTWKKRIEDCGYVWLTQKWKSNMWPITTYHLSCLHKPKRDGKTDTDGTYGGGRFRSAPVNPGLGARKPGQPALPLPGSRQAPPLPTPPEGLPGSPPTPPESESADLHGISALGRKKLRVSPEENFGSEPKPASGESRSQLRARAEASFGSEPKPASGESRSQLRAGAEASFRHKGDSETSKRGSETSFKRSTGLNAARAGGGPRKASPENVFLLDVGAMLERWKKGSSKAELSGSGAWWRLAFRQDPDLMQRVLADTLCAVKEGRVKETPGKMAADTWRRWGGQLPTA